MGHPDDARRQVAGLNQDVVGVVQPHRGLAGADVISQIFGDRRRGVFADQHLAEKLD